MLSIAYKVLEVLTAPVNVVWYSPEYSSYTNGEVVYKDFIVRTLRGYQVWKSSKDVFYPRKFYKQKTYKTFKEAHDVITGVSSLTLNLECKALLTLAQSKGYLVYFCSEIGGYSYCLPKSKLVILSTQRENMSIVFAHELGHLEAESKKLDSNNEVLAWDLALILWKENFSTVPTEWESCKRKALSSYGIII